MHQESAPARFNLSKIRAALSKLLMVYWKTCFQQLWPLEKRKAQPRMPQSMLKSELCP